MTSTNQKKVKLLWEKAHNSGLSRREFLRLIALGGSAAVLAACTSATKTPFQSSMATETSTKSPTISFTKTTTLSPTTTSTLTPSNTPSPTATPVPSATPIRPPQLTLPTKYDVLSTLRTEHPRLLLTSDSLEQLRTTHLLSEQDWYYDLVSRGYDLLYRPLPSPLLDNRGTILDDSRMALDQLYTMSFLYLIDGNNEWLNRAKQVMMAVVKFENWNPTHFLDVAEMSHAMAIGYDWLYNFLTEGEKDIFRQAIVEKGLAEVQRAYQTKAWWVKVEHNWNLVCNGGIAIASLAVADEEPELAAGVLARALSNLTYAFATYASDGAWPEGPVYWGYATQYAVSTIASLESALGADFGFGSSPGLAETGNFIINCLGPTLHTFNFADAGDRGVGKEATLFWLGKRYENPLLCWAGREGMQGKLGKGNRPGYFTLDALWYDDRGSEEDLTTLPLDKLYTDKHIAFFRSAWNNSNAIFLGFKGGDNEANHGHLDLGTFVFDALNTRWALELGPDNYELPGYFDDKQRWTYYRLRTEGHNTLTFDGQNQNTNAKAPITAFHSSSTYSFAIADLTKAYSTSGARRVLRGIALVDNRTRVVVQDELEISHPVDVVWSMHTEKYIEATGNKAILSFGSRKLIAHLLSPQEGFFSKEKVVIALPQDPWYGHKLTVRLPQKVENTRITVLLTPGDRQDAISIAPLDEWEANGPEIKS